MKTLRLLIASFLLLTNQSFSQVAINSNGNIADASAMLDISSTAKGILIPRVSTSDRNSIASPADGLMVYDSTLASFWFYDSLNGGWGQLVNTTTNNLDGLTDCTSSVSNLFLGAGAGEDNTANDNIGIGYESLNANTTGYSNTSIGRLSLLQNTSGFMNTAVGFQSMRSNGYGSGNVAIGYNSLINIIGNNNVGIGTSNSFTTINGHHNVTIGYEASKFTQSGIQNTIIGSMAGKGTSLHSKSGNVFLGYMAGYFEIGDDKLYIENTNSTTPLIGGDFSTDEVYFNTNKIGIGTQSPNELLEVASPTNDHARMILSDGTGDDRSVLLLVSPKASSQEARIEAYNYGLPGGLTLNFNTAGHGQCVFGGHILPENHISKNLGASGQAWNSVYAHNFVTQGSAAFSNLDITKELLLFPPKEKAEGAFDEFTEKGLKELDPASLPSTLRLENAILIDEMTTYNYKANYEQQLQIDELKKENQKLRELLTQLLSEYNLSTKTH